MIKLCKIGKFNTQNFPHMLFLITDLGDIPEIEEVMYLGGCGQHTFGDEVVYLNGGLGHGVP